MDAARATYTTAPTAYDGFGTLSLYASGDERIVLTPTRHTQWQRDRYMSGMYAAHGAEAEHPVADAAMMALLLAASRVCAGKRPIDEEGARDGVITRALIALGMLAPRPHEAHCADCEDPEGTYSRITHDGETIGWECDNCGVIYHLVPVLPYRVAL